jgi:hypothetical protein
MIIGIIDNQIGQGGQAVRIEALLESRKSDIVGKWFSQVADAYSRDTAHFLKNQKDPFANPVGGTLLSGLSGLLDHLVSGADATDFLDGIIRIRAVQTIFSPSQAVSFILDLKKIIRDNLKKEIKSGETLMQLAAFEDKIDALELAAFDVFVKCREKIYEIKANQEKSKVFRAFERAGLITEIQDN